MEIKVLQRVMVKNEAIGNDNRHLLLANNIFSINFTSSPGSGKTTLLESSLDYITKRYKTAVIEGDLYTSRDAERLQKYNLPIIQINTEGGCHLDAKMINTALNSLELDKLDLVLIENVGNLVCPSSFDLGENLRVLLFGITEGADKPKKYATMFQSAHVVLINKIDLAEICEIDLDAVEAEIREINPTCKVFRIAAKKPESLKNWLGWLDETISKSRQS